MFFWVQVSTLPVERCRRRDEADAQAAISVFPSPLKSPVQA